MAGAGKDTPTLPPLKIDHGEKAKSIRSEKPSGIPLPSRAPNVAPNGSRPGPPPARSKSVTHRFLSPAEWARTAHGLGAIREGEQHTVVHPSCWYYPPKGMPDGLYRDVVFERNKNHCMYHILSIIRWILMIVQIVIGAVLTALGSVHTNTNIPITVLAAINTTNAGLLALMHNSGLPDRYRMNKVEFVRVEDFLKELLDTGVIENGQTVDQVLADCFEKFQDAKTTVLHNMPDYYAATQPRLKPAKPVVAAADSDVHGHQPHGQFWKES